MTTTRTKAKSKTTLKSLQQEIAEYNEEKLNSYRILGNVRDENRLLKMDIAFQKDTIGKLREVTRRQDASLDEFREREEIRLNEMANAPTNTKASNPYPKVFITVFRIITNGEVFGIERSSNGGISWSSVYEERRCSYTLIPIEALLEFKSHKKAVKYITDQYGQSATILCKEWRPV